MGVTKKKSVPQRIPVKIAKKKQLQQKRPGGEFICKNFGDLTAWDDWYNDNHLPFLEAQESEASFAQTNELMAGFNKPEKLRTDCREKGFAAARSSHSSCLTVLCEW